jgi:hypothetical protein
MLQGKDTGYKNCNECYFYLEMPILMEENEDAVKIWSMISDQRIFAGMDGVTVALNHIPLWKAIEEYEIEDKIICFEKVLRIAREIFSIEAQEREANRNSHQR